ncbi:MAG: rhodanese-like domain-containing protein [bacterium]
MKKYSFILILVAVLIANIGCSKKSDSDGSSAFRSVSPSEAMKLIEMKRDLLIVDIRSPEELSEGYIAGSLFIPFWEIVQGRKGLPKDRPLLLICAVGGRSYAIGQALAQGGWPEIYNLSGGISVWKREGFPLKY